MITFAALSLCDFSREYLRNEIGGKDKTNVLINKTNVVSFNTFFEKNIKKWLGD